MATIRPATEDDVQLIFDLICELAGRPAGKVGRELHPNPRLEPVA